MTTNRAALTEFGSLPACMGGWCAARNRCAHHLATDRRHVAERLCDRGQEQPAPVLTRSDASTRVCAENA